MFADGLIEKTYNATVHGNFARAFGNQGNGEIKTFMQKIGFVATNYINNPPPEAKLAVTKFKIINFNEINNTTEVLFMPKTGRFHQIRSQVAFFDSPIVGDTKYRSPTKTELKLRATSLKFTLLTKQYHLSLPPKANE